MRNISKEKRIFAPFTVSLLLGLLCTFGCGSPASDATIVPIITETIEHPGEEKGSASKESIPSETLQESRTESKPEGSRKESGAEDPTESRAENPTESTSESSSAEGSSDRKTSEGMPESKPDGTGNASPNGYLVVIDPGHQAKGNSEQEPIGPGATTTKAKVAGGTRGCVSGLKEYELTLTVSEKLKEELETRGYTVQMVRTSNDVNISNAERAEIANKAGADVFIRVHANGSENGKTNGVETLCQTASNPYNASFYEDSRLLSEKVLDGLVNATGAKKRSVVETDSMSGINWCQVPVTIVEMGFMTNETEDALMATEEYQWKMAKGMADGIDSYFAQK